MFNQSLFVTSFSLINSQSLKLKKKKKITYKACPINGAESRTQNVGQRIFVCLEKHTLKFLHAFSIHFSLGF